MELRKTYRFEASHILPKHPGKCARLHGHSWVLHVFVKGDVNPETGFVTDFAEISNAIKPLIDYVDHTHLGVIIEGEIEGLWTRPELANEYPTSENLLIWFARCLEEAAISDTTFFPWSRLAIEETCTSYAELTREEFDAKYAQNTL